MTIAEGLLLITEEDSSFLIKLTPTIAIVFAEVRVFLINWLFIMELTIYLFFQLGVLFSRKAEIPSFASKVIIFSLIISLVYL